MKHYTKEELELFRNGKMSLLSRISCSGHLKNCPDCAGLLEELAEDDKFVADLCSSVQIYQELSELSATSSATAK